MTPQTHTELQEIAREARKKILRMIVRAHASHIGSSYSVIDLLVFLYERVLNVSPAWEQDRDRFILSKGWAASALYVVLARKGFLEDAALDEYCADGSVLTGAVMKCVPGVEATTCSMGHGLPIGVGMALAARIQKSKSRIVVLVSDGECDEGSMWEAALQAGHHKLENLTLVIDYNQFQGFGRVQDVLSLEPLSDKWKSFGWDVREVDGHDFHDMERVFSGASSGKPIAIIARTTKGKGVSVLENNNVWHYKTPTDAEITIAEQEL